MRVCSKCNKSNLPTRKFCIRCGSTLISAKKPRPAAPPPSPSPEIPEVGRVTTGAAVARAEAKASEAEPTTEDKWVRPSEVSRDRVRTAGGRKAKSELEKAREAFARAEEVGIEEEGDGIIETRMLRASEVRELLESSAEMEAELTAEMMAPQPTMMEGSEPLPPEAAEMIQPTIPSPQAVEEQILGSKSGFVSPKPEPEAPAPTPEPALEAEPTTGPSAEFSSSKYGTPEATPFADPTPTVEATTVPASPPPTTATTDIDQVTVCPSCNEVIALDAYVYPKEVYSAMAASRLKQARFLVVQGKGEDAGKILRIAKTFYEKAGDEKGKVETQKLVDSLLG